MTHPVFTKHFTVADEKLRKAPATLSDDDIDTLDAYYGNAEQATRAREVAIAAEHAKAQAAQALAAQRDARLRKGELIDDWAKRVPYAPTPAGLFDALVTEVAKLKKQLHDGRRTSVDGATVERKVLDSGTPRDRGEWHKDIDYWHRDRVIRHGVLWERFAGPTREAPRPGAVCWKLAAGPGDGQP